MKPSTCVLFDMDGVLVDTSNSYRLAIARTLRSLVPDANPFWSGEDAIRVLKAASGFNSDWSATEALRLCALGGVAVGEAPLVRFLDEAREMALGLEGVQLLLGRAVETMREEAPMHPTIARFQAHYLGRALFMRLHPDEPTPQGTPERGLIDAERALVDLSALRALAARQPLGIAIGRPRGEAQHALEVHGFGEWFSALVTHDDVAEAQAAGDQGAAGKPSPWPLREAMRRLGAEEIAFYLGDLPDDMRAANRAGALAIGIPGEAGDGAALRESGAREVFADCNQAIAWCLSALPSS